MTLSMLFVSRNVGIQRLWCHKELKRRKKGQGRVKKVKIVKTVKRIAERLKRKAENYKNKRSKSQMME